MDEFWVCQHCRSLNRSGTGRCYHCKKSFGTKPKATDGVIKGAGAVTNVTPFPGGQAAQGGRPLPNGEPPAYLSTPVVAAPTSVTAFSDKYREAAAQQGRFHRPSLTGWLRRRISNSMAARPYVNVTGLGYVTAALITLVLVDGAMLVATFTPVARTAVANASIDFAMQQVAPSNRWLLQFLLVGMVGVGTLALIAFSLFLGLSTHNAPGLGVQGGRLLPGPATTRWFGMVKAQAFIGAGLIAPAILIWNGYAVVGLIVALVAVEIAQRHLDDPFGWLTQPARHLAELYLNLGTSGKPRSITATLWRYAFLAAHTFMIMACALPIVVVAGTTVRDLTGHREFFDWPGPAGGPLQIAFTAILGLAVLFSATSLGLLVPMTIEMVERQKNRRQMARLSRSRSWAGRPSAATPAATPAAIAAAADAMADEPEDAPRRGTNPWLTSRLGSGPAAGADEPFEVDPDAGYASLNSPSTTSSFPWELPSSDEDSPG